MSYLPNTPGYYDKREMPQPGFYAPYPGGGGGAGQPAIYPQQSPYPPPPPQQPGSQYPPPGLQYPSSGPQYPSLGLQHPSPGMQYPSPGLQYPSSGLQYPSPSTCPYPSPMPPPPPLSTGLPYSPYPGQYPQPASHSTDDAGFGDDSFRAPVQDPSVQEKCNPTVHQVNPFDPRQDAEILRRAMKGFGTDEKAIIQVLTNRVNSQRREIALHFKTMYGKDLISDLKSELSGKFEDLIVALMTPTYDFLAKEIHHAVKGIGTNEETIIEIMCTASNAEINYIKMAYHKLFSRDMESDLSGDTSGHFRRLLVSLCQGQRSEDTFVDVMSAISDANQLLQAGEMRLGTDESVFNMILCSRSYRHLQQVFLEYQNLTGRDFDDAIKSEFSGDIENGLRAIVKSTRDKSAYFAERLHKSMAGFGTNDRALIRIVATRCEIDMVEIKNSYMSMYGTSLESDIADDTSGDYKKCLIALVVG